MANKSKKNTNLIIGICAAVVIVVIIIVAIILGTRDGGFTGLNDRYFVSDGSKYVVTYEDEEFVIDNEEYHPIRMHLVYNYADNVVTGLKAYYEYENDDDAETAYNYFIANNNGEYKNVSRSGKYVILEAPESEYEGLTAEDAKQQVEFMEQIKSSSSDNIIDEEVEETPEDVVESGEIIEETTEEVVEE